MYKLLQDLPLAPKGTIVKLGLRQVAYGEEEIQDLNSNVLAFVKTEDMDKWLEPINP